MASADSESPFYISLFSSCEAILSQTRDPMVCLANISACLYHALNKKKPNSVNWLGFYCLRPAHIDEATEPVADLLSLSAFQGKPAVPFIRLDRGGVCASSVRNNSHTLVPNVHEFAGHIACDPNSQSELVIVLRSSEGKIFALLDVDSPVMNMFEQADLVGLEKICNRLAQHCDWNGSRGYLGALKIPIFLDQAKWDSLLDESCSLH